MFGFINYFADLVIGKVDMFLVLVKDITHARTAKDIEKTRLSQIGFAAMIGVSKRTLENWEQGCRHPTGPAKALLRIIEADPKHALRALHG
ncbi:MAG: transcriptional regulator [Pseudomonadales bacterium]